MKKCLMLVRLEKSDISKMHIAELSGRFNPSAQGLDIIETAAIYHALPEAFLNDHDGKKEVWKSTIEDAFKKMYAQKQTNSLPKNLVRFSGYVNEIPFFKGDDKYHTFCKEISATDDSESFLKLSQEKSNKHLAVAESKRKGDTTADLSKDNRFTTGNMNDDLQNDLKMALSKRNSVSLGPHSSSNPKRPNPFNCGGGEGGNQSMQDELRNVLKKRNNSSKKLLED